MNIEKVEIDNFLRIARMRLDLSTCPVHLIAGHNEAGKTSLQEAIRFCLLGETVRVKLKSEYKLMVKDGAESGSVRMRVDGKDIERDIVTGRGSAEDMRWPEQLAYLLDATRYSWLTEKARRKFMFELMKISVSADDVRTRLRDDHGMPEYMIDTIMPMLKAGFDEAHDHCKNKASEARGGWKAITHENYGSAKAEGWVPEEGDEVDVAEVAGLVAKCAQLQGKVESLAEEVGRTKSGDHMALGQVFNCPSCDARICIDNQHPTPIREITPEEEQRSLEEAQAMTQQLDNPTRQALADTKQELEDARAKLDELKVRQAREGNRDEITKEAAVYHEQVQLWTRAANALAPTGIPAEMIAEKIKPLNDRLRETAVITGWPQVSVSADMKILVENRLFQLQSESAQWRAQAAIAEAISYISGVGIVVLDRVDVLDMKNRVSLIKWAMRLGEDHSTVLLIGTFKEPPKVPAAIQVHWLEAGKEIIESEAA